MKIGRAIAFLVLAGIAGFAVYRYREAAEKQESKQKGRKKSAVVVNMVMPERRNILDERRFSGTANAWSSYDIEPKVSGKLIRLNFDIGDTVKRGSQVAKIDDREYRQQVREAEANLEYARAKLAEARGTAALKKTEFEREAHLMTMDATSQSSYDQAKSNMESQNATAEMCAADVKRCEAVLENARLHLSDTTIMAEWRDGDDTRHIGSRYVDEGTLLQVGKPIVSIVEISRVKANVPIIERDYPFLSVGQKAEVSTDAYPGVLFEGTISNIANTLSDKTRSATAVISIVNKELKLRPGMFIRARILLSEHKNAQTVPVNAVLRRNDRDVVFLHVNGKAVLTPVKTGLRTDECIEILSPEIRDPVVTVGNHLLDDGKEIEISELSRLQISEKLAAGKQSSSAEAAKEQGK